MVTFLQSLGFSPGVVPPGRRETGRRSHPCLGPPASRSPPRTPGPESRTPALQVPLEPRAQGGTCGPVWARWGPPTSTLVPVSLGAGPAPVCPALLRRRGSVSFAFTPRRPFLRVGIPASVPASRVHTPGRLGSRPSEGQGGAPREGTQDRSWGAPGGRALRERRGVKGRGLWVGMGRGGSPPSPHLSHLRAAEPITSGVL